MSGPCFECKRAHLVPMMPCAMPHLPCALPVLIPLYRLIIVLGPSVAFFCLQTYLYICLQASLDAEGELQLQMKLPMNGSTDCLDRNDIDRLIDILPSYQ